MQAAEPEHVEFVPNGLCCYYYHFLHLILLLLMSGMGLSSSLFAESDLRGGILLHLNLRRRRKQLLIFRRE